VLSWPLPGLQAGRMRKGRPILYSLSPGCRGPSREQLREHRGFRSRLVADASGAPVLHDQGPIGRPGTVRPIPVATQVAVFAFVELRTSGLTLPSQDTWFAAEPGSA
jgi:hypothetical protein